MIVIKAIKDKVNANYNISHTAHCIVTQLKQISSENMVFCECVKVDIRIELLEWLYKKNSKLKNDRKRNDIKMCVYVNRIPNRKLWLHKICS